MHHRFTHSTLKSLFTSLAAAALFLSTACSDDPDGNNAPVNTGKDGASTADTNKKSMTSEEPKLKAAGELCTADMECKSQKCADISINDPRDPAKKLNVKACVDCRNDQECAAAAGDSKKNLCVPALPDPSVVTKPQEGELRVTLKCSDGGKGSACIDAADCTMGTKCSATKIGKLTFSTCSVCDTDADCAAEPGKKCLPTTDITKIAVFKECKTPGVNGEFCTPGPNADEQCANLCVEVEIGGFKFGKCGDCRSDMDCKDGKKCEAPDANRQYHACIDPNGGNNTGTGEKTGTGTGTGNGAGETSTPTDSNSASTSG